MVFPGRGKNRLLGLLLQEHPATMADRIPELWSHIFWVHIWFKFYFDRVPPPELIAWLVRASRVPQVRDPGLSYSCSSHSNTIYTAPIIIQCPPKRVSLRAVFVKHGRYEYH